MLSKEEIEKAKECLQETIQNTYAEGKAIKLNNALKYIDNLESDKQKLIEKLEKKIRYYEENDEILATSNDNYSDGTVIKKFIDEFREILQIVKR